MKAVKFLEPGPLDQEALVDRAWEAGRREFSDLVGCFWNPVQWSQDEW